jgi:glycine cleavage system aminomethyltransferase T
MCCLCIVGAQAIPFLKSGGGGSQGRHGCFAVFTNDSGGAIDDSVVTKVARSPDHHVYLIVKAGCGGKVARRRFVR